MIEAQDRLVQQVEKSSGHVGHENPVSGECIPKEGAVGGFAGLPQSMRVTDRQQMGTRIMTREVPRRMMF